MHEKTRLPQKEFGIKAGLLSLSCLPTHNTNAGINATDKLNVAIVAGECMSVELPETDLKTH